MSRNIDDSEINYKRLEMSDEDRNESFSSQQSVEMSSISSNNPNGANESTNDTRTQFQVDLLKMLYL